VSAKSKSRSRPSAAELEKIVRRRQSRIAAANLVTTVMIVLTLLVLAWVAYQLNNPVTIYLSALFGNR
jgi:hypothetical protein